MFGWRVSVAVAVGTLVVDAASDKWLTISSGGDNRQALFHLPPQAGEKKRIPLLVVLHTMAEDPTLTVSLTGFSDLADKEGFAVAYPHGWEYANLEGYFPLGIGFTWNAGACCPKASAKKTDDVQFAKDLVAYVKEHISELSGTMFEVDDTQIYLAGASNGAFMTNRIGCQAPDLFAAIAPVSGMIVNGSSHVWGSDPYDCPPLSKPLPALYFHGTADSLVPWKGNSLLGFPTVESYVKRMQDRNGIVGDAGTVTYKHGDVTCTAYGDVASNFTFCEHESQHCWPGRTTQGPCTTNIDASTQIWAFFKNYRLSKSLSVNTMAV